MTQIPRHTRVVAARHCRVAAVVITWLLLGIACGANSDEVFGTSTDRDEATPPGNRTERTGLEVGTVASLFDLTTVGSSDGLNQDQSTGGRTFVGGPCSSQELELSVSNLLSSELKREFEICGGSLEALELVVTGPNGAEVFREFVARRGDQSDEFPTRSVSSELPFDAPFGRYELTATAEDGSTRVLSFELGAIEEAQLLSIRIDSQPYLVLAGFDPGVVELSVYQATGGSAGPGLREIEVFDAFEFEVDSNVSLLPVTFPNRPLCVTPSQDLEKLSSRLHVCFG